MFEIVILIGAICGPIMVIGSMILLYKGSITLQAASNSDALSIELMKEIKLSTRYPALALFIIGFIFFVAAAWFAQQGDTKKITLDGIVSSPDDLVDVEIHLSAGPWRRDILDERGAFSVLFRPDMESLIATVVAPGYEKSGVRRKVKINQNIARMGTIEIGRRVVSEVIPHDNIAPRQSSSTATNGGQF